jgi:hypothetical protein
LEAVECDDVEVGKVIEDTVCVIFSGEGGSVDGGGNNA